MSETHAAPGPLDLVRQLVNTNDVEGTADAIGSPGRLRAWLVDRDLLDDAAAVDDRDVARAVRVREALRALLLANNGEPLDPAAVEDLNAVASDVRLVVRVDDAGATRLEPAAGGVTAALGRLLAIAYTAAADGTWTRLKACRKHSCRWAFYDHSKNRSRTWCSMAVCGNRVKARSYRERRRSEDGPPP